VIFSTAGSHANNPNLDDEHAGGQLHVGCQADDSENFFVGSID
jgi:hypothetical protein